MKQIKSNRLALFLSRVWQSQKAMTIVWLGVILYTAFFTAISFRRYEAFSYSDFDYAIFVHQGWKGLHGSGNISILNDVPVWGNALELISLVTVPLYLFFGTDPRGLLFWQSFALGAGAIPLFLIARKRLPDSMAVAFAISYLFHPAVWFCNLYEYYPIVYATLTLFTAFCFFERQRFGWFMVFVLLSLVNRVDLGIVTAMFGVYALVVRRSWRWVLWPFLLSVAWVFLGLFVLIPQFSSSNNVAYDSYYSHFGKGFDQILKNMVLHPEILWAHLMTRENGKFLLEMLFPVGFFSLGGIRELLICGLSLIQHLASNRTNEHTIYYHYTATVTPFVYISAVYGMERWLRRHGEFSRFLYALPVVLAVLANCLYGPLSQPGEYVSQLTVDGEDVYKGKMLKEIPSDAPVVSSFEFSPMLAGRQRFYSFHFIYDGNFLNQRPYITPPDIEYALVNFADIRMLGFQQNRSSENIRTFIAGGPFGVVDRINSVVLFKKGYESSVKLFETVPMVADAPAVLEVANKIRLLRAEHQLIQKRGQPVLSMIYQWALPTVTEDNFGVWMRLTDAQGKELQTIVRSMCYGAMPTRSWRTDESYIEYFDWLLPSDLASGEYRVLLSVFSESSGHFLPLSRLNERGQVMESKDSVVVQSFRIP